MKNLTKTYKFLYISKHHYGSYDRRHDFVIGNRMPSYGSWNKWNVNDFLYRVADNTMRKHFSNGKVRKIKSKQYLNGPATEANITKALVQHFTYELNQCRRRLTYLNKEFEIAKTDKVKYPHGVNPMNYNVYNPDFFRATIKHHKENLKIWRAKYNALKDQGVYTYLELMK